MEIFDELNNWGQFTGNTISREEAHKNGAWHRAVLLFIVNSNNQLLMQKRSKKKKLWPSRWDGTGGGHVDAGEIGLFSVIRELKEELGLEILPDQVRYIGGCLSENKTENMWNRHWNEFFVAHSEVDIAKIVLQKDEVEEVKWIDYAQVKAWVEEKSQLLTEKWDAFKDFLKYMDKYVLTE